MPDTFERLKTALADRYAIERELGAGGMAIVYLAEDLKHHRKVAVKVLRPDLAAALGPDRFLREIEVAARLQHPHILPLHDSGEADGFLYYVMPYVEGESLRAKLAREGELPIGDAVRILRDVVDALTDAHEHGVVHRDIKPDNVLLTKHHAVVTDFGIAKAVSEVTGRQQLTTAGVALGTPAYMAPEQAVADPHIDHRADIYAVGALAYELLTGRPPFTGTTPQMILSAHVTEAPEPVTKHRETVPPALAQLVMKCLEKKPADRWQSAEELLPQLEALATPSGGVTPTDTRPVRGVAARSKKVGVGVAAVAAVIAVIVVAMLLPRRSGGALDPNRVLVVAFADESGTEELKALGRMAQDYVIQSLSETGFVEVVDPLTALAVLQNVAPGRTMAGSGGVLTLANEARAGTVVSGVYYAEGDSVHIQTRFTDARDGRLIGTVGPIVGSIGARRDLVARLGREVIAALAPLLDQRLASWEATELQPAAYEAYEAYSEGLETYLRNEYADAARHFERALAADSTFYRAMLWAAQSHLIAQFEGDADFARADSLIKSLVESRERLSRYERYRLDFVRALRPWDNRAAYDAARGMLEAAPGSEDAKREVALFALRLNRVGEAIELLRELDPNRGLMRQWGEYSWYLATAYHMLGDHEKELGIARQGRERFPERLDVLDAEVRALAALGRLDEVKGRLEEGRSLPPPGTPGALMSSAALELRAHGHQEAAREVLDQSIAWYQSRSLNSEELRSGLALSLYLAERWDEALLVCEELAQEFPENVTFLGLLGENVTCLGLLGRLAARRGDRQAALRVSEELRSIERPYMWGGTRTLERARIAAVLEDRDDAMDLLRRAIDQGVYDAALLHRDIDFESLRDYPPFQELMRPKG